MTDPAEWAWFKERNPVFWVEDSIGMAAYRKGSLVAGTVIDNRIGNSSTVHLVIEDPIVLRHGFFEAMFNAAFGHDRKFVFAAVSSKNTKVRKLAKHINFEELCVLEDARAEGDHLVVIRLRREDCKYLGDDDGSRAG